MTAVVTIVRDRPRHLRGLVTGLQRGAALPRELIVVVMGGQHPAGELPPTSFPVRFLDCEVDGADGVDQARETGGTDGAGGAHGGGSTGLPLARARNIGVQAANEECVAVLDVDCIPGAALVAEYTAALADQDALLMGPVRYLGPYDSDEVPREPDLWVRSRAHPARVAPAAGGRLVTTDRYTLFWSLSFAMRRSTYLDIGGFDDTFVGYGGEDTDFAFSAQRAQIPLAWARRAYAYHQHHPTYVPPLPHVGSIVRNARWFYAKWGRWPMEGWLQAFSDAGFINWHPDGDQITLVRLPKQSEVDAARRNHVAPT